jgi:hypothetical protein
MSDCRFFFYIKINDDQKGDPIVEEEFKCNSLNLLIRYIRNSMDKVEEYQKKYIKEPNAN